LTVGVCVCLVAGWLNWPHLAQLESGVGGATASPGPVSLWGGAIASPGPVSMGWVGLQPHLAQLVCGVGL